MARALTLILVVACACGGSETHTTPVPVGQQNDAPPPVDVSWLGGRALVEVMIRADRWPEVRDAARSKLAGTPIPNDLERLFSAATFDEALAMAFRDGRIARELPGLDLTRPLLARLFEPPQPISFEQVMQVAKGEERTPLLHHWLFLPASDESALSATLVERLSERCTPEGEHLRCLHYTVAVLPAEGWVVLAIDNDALPERGSEAEISWALGHPAAIHVRFPIMHEVGPYIGATRVDGALRNAAPEHRDIMLVAGTAELLTAHLHTHPWQEELESIVVAITTEPLGMVGAARLTDRGAGVSLQRATPTSTSTSSPLVVRTGFDLDAAREASPAFETGTLYDSPGELLHALQECGAVCFLHSFSLPFTTARAMRDAQLVSTEEIRYVVDPSLGETEIELEVQVDAMPRPLGEFGLFVPRAVLRARRDGAWWVGALGVPETASLDGLATPSVGVAPHLQSSAEERRCVIEMTLEAQMGLKSLVRVEPSQRPQILTALTSFRDSLGSRCGGGELARSEREAVRAALSVIPPSGR